MRSLVALPFALLLVAACGPSDSNNDDDDNDTVSDQDDDNDSDQDDTNDNDDQVDDLQPDDQTDDTDDVTIPDAAPDGPSPDARPDAPPSPDAMVDAPPPMVDAMVDAPPPMVDAMVDAPPPMVDASIDAPAAVCTINSTLGTVTPPDQFAQETVQSSMSPTYTYAATLNADTVSDAIQIELWDGFGVFETAALGAGTYQITGDELAYATCGACILAFGNVGSDGAAQQAFFATGGTLTISQLGPRFTGTLTNVTFGSVDGATGNPDGLCTTSIASMAFDANIVDATRTAGRRMTFKPIGGKSPLAASQVTCKPKQ